MAWTYGRGELTGIPYTSMREPGGIAAGIGALRRSGLSEQLRLRGVHDAGDLALDEPTGVRGRSGILNEPALARLVQATRARVRRAHRVGRRPLLVGGDCPVLLGALAAIRDDGSTPGLLMVDGHEDAWQPRRSETGEGSNSEIAVALGRVPYLPPALKRLVPLLDPAALAYLGPRDREELAGAGVASLRDEVSYFADDVETAAALHRGDDPAADAIEALAGEAFWVHVDLDVLASDAFAAVDYPQPGGLGWEELDRLATTAARSPRCRGTSVSIYNPALDPDGIDARNVVDFLSRLVERCSPDLATL